MLAQKQAEEAIVANFDESKNDGGDGRGKEEEEKKPDEQFIFSVTSIHWHGGSTWDAWFSCASNQVTQVLLTLPYSFSRLGILSEIIFQVFYGLIGSWTAYLISILYIEYRSRKEKEGFSFKNHLIQWFEVLDGLLGPYWKAVGLAFNRTFLLFRSVIQLIGCARIRRMENLQDCCQVVNISIMGCGEYTFNMRIYVFMVLSFLL